MENVMCVSSMHLISLLPDPLKETNFGTDTTLLQSVFFVPGKSLSLHFV